MIESHIRGKVQPYFNQIAAFLRNISPNKITLLAFITGVISALFICTNYFMIALGFLIISGFFDVLDGTVARINKKAHPTGAYIDLISDRMVESALILGFTVMYPQHYFAYILFLIALLFHFSQSDNLS